MIENKRIDWIDAAKGFAIILVVYGHCLSSQNLFSVWVTSFHMPIFFIVSGYLLGIKHRNTGMETFGIKRKLQRLMVK